VGLVLAGLGPDALAVARKEFGRLLSGRGAGIKATLPERRVLAGLGNLLVDEILWRARVHPRRPAGSLSPQEQIRLFRQMKRVLSDAVPEGRVPPKPS
jgi:formamidopyrimidine-DNA glycosylase